MRIPRYRLQSQITTQAPGQRITARKRAQPFIQEIEQKAAVQTELFSQAANYAANQRKLIIETRKNEAILGAKEAMIELSNAFLNDKNPYDIFPPEGGGRWEKETNDIKNKLRLEIGTDRYALAAFDQSFAQAELPLRFDLKGKIDTKIEKMHVASVNEGWEDFITKYSYPYVDTTTFDLEFAAEKQKTNKSIELGRIEKEAAENLPTNVLKRIATDLMPAYAGRDLNKAMDVIEAFNQIQLEAAGKIEEATFSNDIPPHVINVLKQISPADAQEILVGTLDDATKFYNFQEKIEDEILETQNRKNTKAYNFALGVHNGDKVTVETMQQFLNPLDLAKFENKYSNVLDKDGHIAGLEAKHFINDVLGAKGQFWLNREQQEQLAKELDVETNVIFATPGEGNAAEYSRLFAKAEAGMLTTQELNNSRPLLEASQHRGLVQQMQSESDEALNEAKTIIKFAFRYNELQAIGNDDNLAQASKSGYEAAARALTEETIKRQIAQNPMTRKEMFEFAQEQIDQFMIGYTAALRVEYNQFLEQQVESFTLGFPIDPNNPIQSVQDWFNNLDETQQQKAKDKLAIFVGAIRSRFSGTGLFNE